MPKTILRLTEEIRFPNELGLVETKFAKLPLEIETNLKNILGEFEVEYYPRVPDLKRSYQRRMASLHKSVLFILETFPELKEKMDWGKYLKWCQAYYTLPSNEPIETYQEILTKYTGLLVNALVDHYPYEDDSGDKVKSATELLNKAEQYVIMKEGRADLATLIPMKINESAEYVLRFEKQLPPYSAETFQEFSVIKKAPLTTTPDWFYGLSPFLQSYLCCVPGDFKDKSDLQALSDIKYALNQFSIAWMTIQSQRGAKLQNDLNDIANNKLPPWFSTLPIDGQQMIKLFSESKISAEKITEYLSQFEKQIQIWAKTAAKKGSKKDFNAQKLNSLRALPYWYLVLEDFEQRFLKGALDSTEHLEEAISFVPSRLRRLPLAANFCESNFFTLKKDGAVAKKYSSRIRASHLASRDVKKLPPQVRKLHAKRNLSLIASHAAQQIFLFIQTLISPVRLLGSFIPDYYLDQERLNTVADFQKQNKLPILSTNHPLNMAKYPYYTPSDSPASLALLKVAEIILLVREVPELNASWDLQKIETVIAKIFSEVEATKQGLSTVSTAPELDGIEESAIGKLRELFNTNYELFKSLDGWQQIFTQHLFLKESSARCGQEELGAYLKNLQDLEDLAKEYSNTLNSSYGSATVFDYYGRELFLSSQENLLVMLAQGKSAGSCVSGKDRKEVETNHTYGMWLYRDKTGHWPSMKHSGSKREEFVDIVAELEVSKHGRELAGQNAPGSDGTKTPENYWPTDIAEAIRKKECERALLHSDILATNNEVGRIGDLSQLVRPGFTGCINAAQRLSDEQLKETLGLLAILCGEQKFLNSKTWKLPMFSSDTPKGMEEIKKIMHSPGTDENSNIEKMARVYFEIQNRPKEKWTRAPEIQQIYDTVMKLFSEDPKVQAAKTIACLRDIKNTAFSSNNLTPQSPVVY
ncbi:Dot/Icm T4SS effector PI-3-phosphatase SidP [Legionella cardiaca]|uniref:Oxidoreductase n=1 Tax=Legionella cardiaca TaxID=1071983 RepID=A0ABY8AQB7_9GAMM|nr:Dot/Icm T4SS effector PI-3-phosphatase SidP [Legionella cardiaca]WED42718.1 hypothetical protein PXX05_12555 [Legionella cardiaca]